MGTTGSYHNYLSLWKGMVIPNGGGEPRQHAGEDGGDRAGEGTWRMLTCCCCNDDGGRWSVRGGPACARACSTGSFRVGSSCAKIAHGKMEVKMSAKERYS